MGKVVLAYSGGLDTSCAIRWIKEEYESRVVTVTVDVGQGEDLTHIREKALRIGAEDALVFDKKSEFVKEYVLPSLKANACYEGVYPLISALARPLIAKTIVGVAEEIGAEAVAHGCTAKGNDQVRFDLSFRILNPSLEIIAPIRQRAFSRSALIDYAVKNDIPVPVTKKNPYSIDFNLWGRSIESGLLEDPSIEPPEDAFEMTTAPERASDRPTYVEIGFSQGTPVSLDGKKIDLVNLIEKLNTIGGSAGFGRIDHMESRLVGIKSRELYEAPAAMALIEAHRALESMTLPGDFLFLKKQLEEHFTRAVYFGKWFSPAVASLNAFIEESQKNVTGKVRIKFYRGNMSVVGRESEFSLYQQDLATYGEGDRFDHGASEGFIKIFGLDSVLYEQKKRKGMLVAPGCKG